MFVRNDGFILGCHLPIGDQRVVFRFPVWCVVPASNQSRNMFCGGSEICSKKDIGILGQGLNIRHWGEGGWLVGFPGHLLGSVLLVVVLLLKRFKGIRHWVWFHILMWFRFVVSVRTIPGEDILMKP